MGSAPDSLIILTGPSGVGKGSLLAELMRRRDDVRRAVSVTTRPPRAGEIDGEHYYFISEEEFASRQQAGELLEGVEYAGRHYGTLHSEVIPRHGEKVVLEIEVQGARRIREVYPDARFIFIAPPSTNELQRRLHGRGSESDGEIASRLKIAGSELLAAPEFDRTVVNDDLERAVAELSELI